LIGAPPDVVQASPFKKPGDVLVEGEVKDGRFVGRYLAARHERGETKTTEHPCVADVPPGTKKLTFMVEMGGKQVAELFHALDSPEEARNALVGRVYCNVDATEEAVRPGDLLTTSSTPGYAMKVKDYTRAQGAILGKAMDRLERGKKGQILVLVTLQ